MSVPGRAPRTIGELQAALRLKDETGAEALVKAAPVKEAFRMYMNRCLSSSSTKQQLADWKDVDEYLLDQRTSRLVRRMSKTLQQVVDDDCFNKPYDLVAHASLFALRIMTFLKSDKGEMYDISLEDHAIRRYEDISFDRCRRIVSLLGYLVHQNGKAKRKAEMKMDQEMKEKGWI
ncbi:hypothetical protein F4819DRAFT_359377 [Hypoxylon fuscum]|nr:hypothetical protein F4819DRAFT_359377 [Hypoxylon fuscum]